MCPQVERCIEAEKRQALHKVVEKGQDRSSMTPSQIKHTFVQCLVNQALEERWLGLHERCSSSPGATWLAPGYSTTQASRRLTDIYHADPVCSALQKRCILRRIHSAFFDSSLSLSISICLSRQTTKVSRSLSPANIPNNKDEPRLKEASSHTQETLSEA
jgi:hypothetical protein